MPRHANSTSFKPGHKRSPETIEKQRQTIAMNGRKNSRKDSTWSEDQKAKYKETMKKKFPPTILICQYCNKEYVLKRKYKDRIYKYCSRYCGAKAHAIIEKKPTLQEQILQLWNQKYSANKIADTLNMGRMMIRRWLINQNLFESRHASGEQVHNWQGGRKVYRRIALKHHGSKCNRCGYNKYINVLQIHHIDRDRNNNSPENLIPLCPTCHEEIHFETRTGSYLRSKGR